MLKNRGPAKRRDGKEAAAIKYEGHAVTEIKIAYLGGGSRGWARTLMSDLALEEQLGGVVYLYDIDRQAAGDNESIGNSLARRDETKGKWTYKAVASLGEALDGADFVIISILPGTLAEMHGDVHLPEKYGIYQSVGDTTGPGGLVRALRTVPIYADFAAAIRARCPGAWVINYTNPMSICTRTLYEVFPGVKAFGCCHEVFHTQRLLAAMLAEMGIAAGVKRREIRVNVLGINHFTWIDQATYGEVDLVPLYREFVAAHFAAGFEPEKDAWQKNVFVSAERVKFDLFRRYGLIAAAGDRHLAEFLPPWYLRDPETVRSWKFTLTSVDWRVRDRAEKLARTRKLVDGEEAFTLKHSDEEGIDQIKALLGLKELITNVNLPNRGQMDGIPRGAVVETNAFFSRDAIRPLLAGQLPAPVQNLVLRNVLNQETILRAALTRDKDLAMAAFLNDPLVTVGLDEARELFRTMLAATKEYLTGWDV